MLPADIYPGTPIEWLPIWAASVWRFLYFIATVSILVRFAFMTVKRHGRLTFRTITMRWMWWAILIALARSLVGQIERFGDQAVYEGLPVNTVLLAFVWLAIRSYERDQ